MKLTEEQQIFATKNHNLIYKLLNLRSLMIDEWYGIASIAYCKSIPNWDVTKGKFGNFAFLYMNNEINKVFQGENTGKRKGRKETCSLDYLISGSSSQGVDNELIDTITDNINYENDTIFGICIKNAKNILNIKQRKILDLCSQGYSQREIGEVVNMTQQGVNLNMKKIRDIVRLEYTY